MPGDKDAVDELVSAVLKLLAEAVVEAGTAIKLAKHRVFVSLILNSAARSALASTLR